MGGGISDLKTGLAGIGTSEKRNMATSKLLGKCKIPLITRIIDENSNTNRIVEVESDEEVMVRRPQTRGAAGGKKRALVDDDESYEESKGHKSEESAEESLGELEDEDSYGSGPVKKKKKPAKRAPPASAPLGNKKNSLASTAGELKKRPSEVTATMIEDTSYVDAEDQVIGGGFTSMDEILDARPYFIKEHLIKDL